MTLKKEASLMDYVRQRAAASLRWHQIEKRANLFSEGSKLLSKYVSPQTVTAAKNLFSDKNVGKAALGVAGVGTLYGGYKGVQAARNKVQKDRQAASQRGFNPKSVY